MSGVDVVGGYDNELFWPCLIVKFSIHSLIMLEECSKLLWKTTMTPANSLSLLGSSELDKNLLDEASASAQPQNALFVCLFNFWSQTFPLHHRLHKLILSHLKMKPFSCWFSYVFYFFLDLRKNLKPTFPLLLTSHLLNRDTAAWRVELVNKIINIFLPKSQKILLW